VLLQCSFSWNVWRSIAEDLGQRVVLQATFKQFYSECLSIKWRSKNQKRLWIATIFAVPWRLWMVRNEKIFQQKDLNLDELCHSIKWKVAAWTKTWTTQLPYRVEDLARNFNAIPAMLINQN